jgi:membrane fusion protein, multidrug efflux system
VIKLKPVQIGFEFYWQSVTESLSKQGAASLNELDRSKSRLESSRHARESSLQSLTMLQKGTRSEDISAAHADLQTAKGQVAESRAAVDRANLTIARASVYAPFDGWVARRWLDPGVYVTASRPVLSLFDPSTLRVDANIEEKHLNSIAIGDEVDINVDAYPDLKLKGRLTEILRGANSQFSMVPSEGTSGTFIKVSQRVPIRISVQAPQDIPLGPGLSVVVKIHVKIP